MSEKQREALQWTRATLIVFAVITCGVVLTVANAYYVVSYCIPHIVVRDPGMAYIVGFLFTLLEALALAFIYCSVAAVRWSLKK